MSASSASVEKPTEEHVEKGYLDNMNADERLLHELGYRQDLSRSISAFSNFAIAYSCCSVLAALPPMWGDAMIDAGSSSVIWGWVITSIFTMLVAMSLAEICSAYPTTGGLYFWVSRLATAEWVPLACWLTGWCNWIGLAFAITSIDLGLAQFIAGIIQIWDPEANTSVYMQYGIFIGIIIIHGILNSVAVKWNGVMNQGAFFANMVGIIIIVIAGLAITRPLNTGAFVFGQFFNGSGFANDPFAFLLVILQSQYTLSGYDSAAHMSEETQNSQRGSANGILLAVAANAVSGFVFLIGIAFMVKDYDRQILGESAIQPQMVQVFLDGVGPAWTVVFLVFVMVSIFFCGSSLTLGSSRMIYAFARDGAMPFSKHLHSLNKQTNNPVIAVWFNIIVAGVIGILYMINSTAYEAIVSVNTIGAQLSYLIPIVLRITISRKSFVPGPWHLGKFSTPVGIISSCWLVFTCVLFVLPVEAPVTADNMNYAIVPFAAIMLVSSGYFYFWGRKWFTGPVRIVDGQKVILEDDEDAQTQPYALKQEVAPEVQNNENK
ncbi:amino acid/polyamine transporter I [Radiomyces spectabilis]|uniref:amino acid/polyamine transporter I n=1 Tax=Radiomyces spectabilis TaxID=64574 RepID=UPI00221F6188|nr:amino acid/polyamine transporter I [Radiomyces spectabilis]KAI8391378.1 amino acid/polyamine transporter I [Radiomyces spectabilis]